MKQKKIINVYNDKKINECSHGGVGSLKKIRAYDRKRFQTNIEFVDYVEVSPGQSIGYHKHSLNEEIYFLISGSGTMIINGIEQIVCAGDVVINECLSEHGLNNNTNELLKLLIFQVNLF